MSIRKKGLALILCLVMGMAALAGCEKGGDTGTEKLENENEIEVPEVNGKEKTIGAFTLLVPEKMDAAGGDSESEVTLSDDDDNYILLQVVEKKEAKNHIKELQEENEKLKEESFTLNGISWTGVSGKKFFCVYGKVGSHTVLASSQGFKLTDDISLAVLASLEVSGEAQAVSAGGSLSVVNKMEVFCGLYSIEYSNLYKEGEYDECLESVDGSSQVYMSFFNDAENLYSTMEQYEDYDCEEIVTSDGTTGYLYESEYGAYYIVPLENYYEAEYIRAAGVYIFTYNEKDNAGLREAFKDLCRSTYIDPQYRTDEVVEPVTYDWAKYWEQGWYGCFIIYDGKGKYKDDIAWYYDCLATFSVESDGKVWFEIVPDEGVDHPTAEMELIQCQDDTEMGYLCVDSGKFSIPDTDGEGNVKEWVETTVEYDDWTVFINPEEDMKLLDDYLTFCLELKDSDGDEAVIKGFFRPWGTDWSDLNDVPAANLPDYYVGEKNKKPLIPGNYSDWYTDKMYYDFPGIWGFEN